MRYMSSTGEPMTPLTTTTKDSRWRHRRYTLKRHHVSLTPPCTSRFFLRCELSMALLVWIIRHEEQKIGSRMAYLCISFNMLDAKVGGLWVVIVVEDLQTMIFFINGLAEKPPPVAIGTSRSWVLRTSRMDSSLGFWIRWMPYSGSESSGVQRSWKLGQHGFFLMYILYIVYTHMNAIIRGIQSVQAQLRMTCTGTCLTSCSWLSDAEWIPAISCRIWPLSNLSCCMFPHQARCSGCRGESSHLCGWGGGEVMDLWFVVPFFIWVGEKWKGTGMYVI